MDALSPANRALFDRVWEAHVGPPRGGFYAALNHLLDEARKEGGSAVHPLEAVELSNQRRGHGASVGLKNRRAVLALMVAKPGIKQNEIAPELGLSLMAVNRAVKEIRQLWR